MQRCESSQSRVADPVRANCMEVERARVEADREQLRRPMQGDTSYQSHHPRCVIEVRGALVRACSVAASRPFVVEGVNEFVNAIS